MELKNECMFSAIVMFHNHEEYVEKTLTSILGQEHDYSWEMLVCDDASTDGTKAIIEQFVKRYPGIIRPFYRSENWGLVKNRFDLISKAKGKYYSQCDGDDFWFPGKVQEQIKYMEANPDVDYCCTDIYCYFIDGKFFYQYPDAVHNLSTPFPYAPGAYCEMCAKTSVIKKYITEVHPESRVWAYDDVPLAIWMKRNAKWGRIDKNYVALRWVDGSVSRPKKRDIEWIIWYYEWVLDVWRYFSNGTEEEENFIRHKEVLYDMFCALDAGDKDKYRMSLTKQTGSNKWMKVCMSYLPFGMKLLVFFYNKRLNKLK